MPDPGNHAARLSGGMTSSPATVRRDGDALVFDGAIERAAVAALWRQAQPLLVAAQRLDLRGVGRIDSAGLALLAQLAGAAEGDGALPTGMDVLGAPAGLDELRAAYRLDARLSFAR